MPENSLIIEKTIRYVKQTLEGAEGGHDWWHIYRVWKLSLHIARFEKVDLLTVELAALLHDIADAKFHGGDEEKSPRLAAEFLQSLNLNNNVIKHVIRIIENISFRSGSVHKDYYSTELGVVQDADRLDAMGAIGIARAFNYGGHKGREIYNPGLKPQPNMDKEAYRKNKGPTINHFYEKLLLLKDRMNTQTGKSMAESRHAYMEDFLMRFSREWEGEV